VGVAVAFDIFRCCTTIHALFARNAGEVMVARTLKEAAPDPRVKNWRVFSELSQEIECAERFDNSPARAAEFSWRDDRPALVATTSGTPSFFAAREFERVYIGSLVNYSALVRHLLVLGKPVTLFPSALSGSGHVEDEIAAYGVATALEGFANMPEFVRQCGEQAVDRVRNSPRPAELAAKISTGAEDAALALSLDRYDQVLCLDFEKGAPFARVVRA
jgi:phosphosulfolactate phosphohydrolase-like enzyme